VTATEGDRVREQPVAYLRRSILNAQISRWRRHRGAELSVAEPPERIQRDAVTDVDDRLSLLPLVRRPRLARRLSLLDRTALDAGNPPPRP
jgi:hypothetical protein